MASQYGQGYVMAATGSGWSIGAFSVPSAFQSEAERQGVGEGEDHTPGTQEGTQGRGGEE